MVDVPRSADVVIVGGGVHGASLAYHLARKKAGRVVLIEKKFIASGPTGRSTALVRRFYAMDSFTRTASAAADMFAHWKDVIGGDGDPASTANALVNRARELGATIVQYRHVDAIRAAGNKVVGVTSEGIGIDAPVVVNCAGLWADRLLRPLGIEVSIEPERHQMCFF